MRSCVDQSFQHEDVMEFCITSVGTTRHLVRQNLPYVKLKTPEPVLLGRIAKLVCYSAEAAVRSLVVYASGPESAYCPIKVHCKFSIPPYLFCMLRRGQHFRLGGHVIHRFLHLCCYPGDEEGPFAVILHSERTAYIGDVHVD